MKTASLLVAFLLAAPAALPQPVVGFDKEYLADFNMTAKQLMQLAEAVPAEKYSWRPGPGVRSFGEVYVHIAAGNFLLLALAGTEPPVEYFPAAIAAAKKDLKTIVAHAHKLETMIESKPVVLKMLQASLDAVRMQMERSTPAKLDRPADFFGESTTVRRIYLRILAHVNEHYGQSIAYARVNGIVPPWSKAE